jgi:uroporphyrinogen III methyltransferase/synthase
MADSPEINFVVHKPLSGRRIVVTRPRAQAADFIERLSAAGADVVACPIIEIVPPPSWAPLDDAIGRIGEFDWLVFTSTNGVDVFFERLHALGRDVPSLHRARLAAIGPQTAHALERRGLRVDVVPDEFRAEGVAEEMQRAGIAGARVLLPRAAGAREILPAMLRQAGARVEEVASYDTARPLSGSAEVRRLIEEGGVDLVTFTSSSTVRNFLALLGEDAAGLLRQTRIGCIGPITAETARSAGLTVDIQPSAYTVAAFSEEIVRYFANLPPKRGVRGTKR